MNQTIRRLNIETETRCVEYLEKPCKGVKYRLQKDYFVQTLITCPEDIELGCIVLYKDGGLLISAGFEWNGANVVFDTDSVMRASLVHDAFCDLVNSQSIIKENMIEINNLYRQISKEDGASRLRYTAHRFALRKYRQGWFG